MRCAPTASSPVALTSDVHDVLAPGEGAGSGPAAGPLVEAARRLASELLEPAAQATDQGPVVPRRHLDALAAAGLCRLWYPPGIPVDARREIFEILAGACGVTFFVWVQHHAPVRMLAGSPNEGLRRRWLDRLCTGRVLGGVAFAYLRRPGAAAVAARRIPGGWQVDGQAPWVTSWGLAGLYVVAARAGEDVVFFVVGGGRVGVRAGLPAAGPGRHGRFLHRAPEL